MPVCLNVFQVCVQDCHWQYQTIRPFWAVEKSVIPCVSVHHSASVVWTWAYGVGKAGRGSPSWAVIISRAECQRALMTAWLCGCWRGAIRLKSLVWQALGPCRCLYNGVCASVWVCVCAPVCDYTSECAYVGLSLSLSASRGEGLRGAASVNIRNRNKPPNSCRQGWKQKEQQGENWFHLSSSACLILLGGGVSSSNQDCMLIEEMLTEWRVLIGY